MNTREPVLSDAELMEDVAQGDVSAFAAFYDRHAPVLFSVALRILDDPHEAEDILQEAAVHLWERAPQYDAAFGKPLSWAIRLTRNQAIDRLRLRLRKSHLHDAAAIEAGFTGETEPAAPPEAVTSETAVFVKSALKTLPTDQRQAIELAFFSGLTQTQIATRFAAPLGTVKARIRRGMLALRHILERRR